jgi:NAD(P)H-hydrate epimerase
MITAEIMGVVDENAEALGVPRKQLMESSGNAVARTVRDAADEGASVTLVCGRGNNGGDAFVAARFLKGYDVRVLLLGREESISTDIARENWEALGRGDLDAEAVRDSGDLDLHGPDVVVDAMLGTGITGELREPEATAAERINASDATVVAVDIPSGVDADTGEPAENAVEADRVVTFHDRKPGLEDIAAEVRVEDIGIPEAAERFTGPGYLSLISRDPNSHKGENGDVLVVGGGPFTGAPALSTEAAFRAGADLINTATPESVKTVLQTYGEDLMVRGLPGDHVKPDHVDELLDLADGKDAVAIGPGLGTDEETMDALRDFFDRFDGDAVVDADALHVVPEVDTDADLICTPNGHELEAMGCDAADERDHRAEDVREFAAELGQVVVAKGPNDIVSDGDRVRINRVGNSGMTVGGTGDILTGITASFRTTLDPFVAAIAASWVNGRAGDLAYEKRGNGFVASDMVEEVPYAMRRDTELANDLE